MPAVDNTVGGVASNSYVSRLEATTYFESAYGKTLWVTADQATQEQLVISATGALDAYLAWDGQQYSIDQALNWPRINAYDRDRMMYSYTSIPHTIKVATFELAYHLLANGGLTYDQNKIDEIKVGSIGVKFSKYITETGIPAFIEAMLSHVAAPLFRDTGKMTTVRLERS